MNAGTWEFAASSKQGIEALSPLGYETIPRQRQTAEALAALQRADAEVRLGSRTAMAAVQLIRPQDPR